jgi:hypothetical protein
MTFNLKEIFMQRLLLIPVVAMLLSFTAVYSQSLTVEPYGVSPGAIVADTVGNPGYLGIKDRISTGLHNVGVEAKVYMIARMSGSALMSPVWTLYEKPGSSATELSASTEVDTSSEIVTFVPDKAGTYRISVTDGAEGDTIVFNAGTYKGVEDNCKLCHNGGVSQNYQPWSMTGHATMMDRGLDGEVSSHYGESCISCHSVGYDTLATNDGFDDFDFVFPSVLKAGVADSLRGVYPDAMARANIQCESCHGPGSAHMGNVSDAKIDVSVQVDVCASCHDDANHHVFPEQWAVSVHADLPRKETRTNCAPCHNGKGFIEWVDGGKAALTENIDANYNITCASCHDPHDATNEHQLRTVDATLPNGVEVTEGGNGKLCMNCHNSRRDASTYIAQQLASGRVPEPHHGPQAEMLTTENVYTFGLDLGSSPHLQATENGCVDCHMFSQDVHDANGNLVTAGMHSFAMVDQQGVDNVAACEQCHAPFGDNFSDKKYYLDGNADHDGNGVADGLQIEVEGLLDTLYSVLPQDSTGELVADSTTSVDVGAAMYNYYFVEEDKSMGVHNPRFAVKLLQASIDAVRGVNSVETRGFKAVSYELSQNYPNPFNPTTQIDFGIKKAGKVQIRVYDMLGREVATLVDKDMSAGKHTVTFDASNLATGVYIYRIVAGNEFTAVKKMVLIR